MWQGLADQLIFTGDSINYYNRALAANGGIRNTESFFRYTGGNPNVAASYTCSSRPHFTNPFLLNGQHG